MVLWAYLLLVFSAMSVASYMAYLLSQSVTKKVLFPSVHQYPTSVISKSIFSECFKVLGNQHEPEGKNNEKREIVHKCLS